MKNRSHYYVVAFALTWVTLAFFWTIFKSTQSEWLKALLAVGWGIFALMVLDRSDPT